MDRVGRLVGNRVDKCKMAVVVSLVVLDTRLALVVVKLVVVDMLLVGDNLELVAVSCGVLDYISGNGSGPYFYTHDII